MTDRITHRLLIVDDDPLVCAMVKDHFETAGFSVDSAQDPQEALGRLSQFYDAVLSDVLMPKVSGIELLQEVRRRMPKAVVFLMTARPSVHTLNIAKHHGAVAYFRKPLNLPEVEARIRGFLGETPAASLASQLLVIGRPLLEQLGDRLDRPHAAVCEPTETAFLQAVRSHQPRAVLADAADSQTPRLLHAYQGLGPEANSFLLVGSPAALEAAGELLLQGATGCLPLTAPQPLLERCIRDAIALCERERQERPEVDDGLGGKCGFARAYRNGYYCLAPGSCPHGAFQEGWIALGGKEHRRCAKRPLLVPALARVGLATWAESPDPGQADTLRTQLSAMIRAGKRILVVDATRLAAVTRPLCDALSDLAVELEQSHPPGLLHVINVPAPLQETLRTGISRQGVQVEGGRMLDTRMTFERWGSRFD